MTNAYLLAVLITAAAPPFSAQTLDGESFHGPIIRIDSKQVTVETGEGQKSLEIEKLIRLEPQKPPEVSDANGRVWIELVDGSLIVADDYAVDGHRGRLLVSDENVIELPVTRVAAVRLQDQSKSMANEWMRIRRTESDSDMLVIRKGEVLNYHRGVLRDVTDTVAQFEIDGEVLSVKRSKIHGLVYHRRSSEALPDSICVLGDTTGSRWSVRSLATAEEAKLQWTTPAGATMTRPLAMVTQIDFSQGKVAYLSDLNWESFTFTPYFGTDKDLTLLKRFLAPRKDTNLHSDPLRFARKEYEKGLSIHSRTEIVYRLPGRFRRFRASAGIDDSVRPHGNVQLVISGDGEELFRKTIVGLVKYQEGEESIPPGCKAGDPRQLVDIDLEITGVRRLTLLVDFGGELDVSDHLDLCNARVVK